MLAGVHPVVHVCNMNTKIFKCMIVDDEQTSIRSLQQQLNKIPELQVIASFTDPVEGLEALTHGPLPDFLFLDVQMDGINGLELLRRLPNRPPAVILRTVYKTFAADGFDLDITDFLLKPTPFDRLLKAVRRGQAACGFPGGEHPVLRDYIQVWFNKAFHIIYLSSINYIRVGEGSIYLSIDENDEQIRVNETLEHMLARLPQDRFVRIHRQHAIQVTRAEKIQKGFVKLSIPENMQLSMSREGQTRLLEAMGIRRL